MDNSENKSKISGNLGILRTYTGSTFKLVWVCFLWVIAIGILSYCTTKQLTRFVRWGEIRGHISEKCDNRIRDVKIIDLKSETYYDRNKKDEKFTTRTDKYITIHDLNLNRNFRLEPSQLEMTDKDLGTVVKMNISEEFLVGDDNIDWMWGAKFYDIWLIVGYTIFYFFGFMIAVGEEGNRTSKRMNKNFPGINWERITNRFDNVMTIFPFTWAGILFGIEFINMMVFWL